MELNHAGLRRDIIVIGASAGGLAPMLDLVAAIPAELPVIIAAVLHRSPFGPNILSELLERRAQRTVVEPLNGGVRAVAGTVYLGPRDLHLVFNDGVVLGRRSAKQHYTRPAVDPLFISAAESYGSRVLGVLLSGGGTDGVLGLIRIKTKGGLTLVQRPDEARQPSMPATALREDDVDAALSVAELLRVVPALARGQRVTTPHPASS